AISGWAKDPALTGRLLYGAACLCGAVAGQAAKDAKLPTAERDLAQEKYLALAVELLRRASATGYFASSLKRENVRSDKDLALLQGRKDFQQFLADIEKPDTR